jgi:GDPmannose 4,6-dehydratase
MFGASPPPQSERTPFHPRSPYGVSKLAAYWHCVNYREAYQLFVSNGILFNHESPRRGETFVTRKVTRAVGRIVHGLQKQVHLGNLEARRDWGFAGDHVDAMWRMLQHPEPDDFVIATGTSHSVRDLLGIAFGHVGLEWRDFVAFDPRYVRPSEADHLEGDASKARKLLGWKPTVSFEELVRTMVEHDLQLAARERMLADHGHDAPARGAASP